jgi:hypothetical protein
VKRPKLGNLQIWLLLYIEKQCSLTGRMMLRPKHREIVVPLWRRDLVEIWWRQPSDGNRPRGPYFSLTADGFQLACSILAAREERGRKRYRARVEYHPPQALAA